MNSIFEKMTQNLDISQDDIVSLLKLEDFSKIFELADKINFDNFKNKVDIRAILEFSNNCKRKCAYCGLNSNNKKLTRYRMTEDEILQTTFEAYNAGYKTIVLQSGEDSYFTSKKIGNLVKKIKENIDIAITVSCGEMSYEDYKYIKECGADRYLLKHETSDEKLYSSLHSCGTLRNRIKCLKNLKTLSYYTGGGFMIGLPGQTLHTIANDILTLKSIPCDMAGIGPFISSNDTPLRNMKNGDTLLVKKAVAITRILLPKSHLPATTALGVIDSKEKDNIFSCGANVIMRKVTPQKYEQFYSIYPNKIKVNDIIKDRKNLEQQIINMGKIPV
jgi:iron-only hydrogenase maturation rSAM protein hydE